MKVLLPIIILLSALSCWAQPTGHAKLFLEITDKGDTIKFKSSFKTSEPIRKIRHYDKNYQLNDLSDNPTGFSLHIQNLFIHKTLMDSQHQIQIVKNNTDTMRIEILNAYNNYFLSIPFQKGNFRLAINDGKMHKWNYNTLRYKRVSTENFAYDITPKDWRVFEVSPDKTEQNYFISIQFEQQHLLEKPVIPEDDPNFQNPRRVLHLRVEVGDYNFDGQKDYREHKMNDTTTWNYFIYKDSLTGYALDTLLSSLDKSYFDFEKNTFQGCRTTRIDSTLTQMDNYEFLDGKIRLVRQMKCVQAFPNSEKKDCSVYELIDGEWVLKKRIKGAE